MSGVTALGYIGVGAPDLDAWSAFATDVLGMQLGSPNDGSDTLFLRMDERSYRVAVERGDPGLAYLGFELATRGDLDALGSRLESAGIVVKEDSALASIRRVHDLLTCADPAGNSVELYVGHKIDESAFVSPRGVRFVTGDMGFGHVFLLVPDEQEAKDFYIDLLGFRVSDTIAIGPSEGVFLHCNPRHHTLAFAAIPGVPMSAMQHFMVEVDSLDGVGRAIDIVNAGAATATTTLGMHTNDHMVSFYLQSPSGFDIEYGWNGRTVDDEVWTVGSYAAPSFWGHQRLTEMPMPEPAG
jgi:2,3-dihydroxybiphenyl 1,2-dioxygenase